MAAKRDCVRSLAVAALRRHAPPPSGRRFAPHAASGRQRPAAPRGTNARRRHNIMRKSREMRPFGADPQEGGRTSGHPPSAIDQGRVCPHRFFGRYHQGELGARFSPQRVPPLRLAPPGGLTHPNRRRQTLRAGAEDAGGTTERPVCTRARATGDAKGDAPPWNPHQSGASASSARKQIANARTI